MIFYERTVRPLTAAEKQRFHAENLVAAELILLPRERVPATYDDLTEYIRDVIDSDRLQVTDVAREVADLIRGGPVPWHLKPIWKFISFAAIGTLPDEVRRLYGFRWSRWRQRWLGVSLRALKVLRPLLPTRFRLILPARVARRRLAGEQVPMPRP